MKTAGVVIDFYDDPNGSLPQEGIPHPRRAPGKREDRSRSFQ
jgi:hypothetical protein